MIPKVIHYCWFGGNPKPDSVKKCIESWSNFCPDFELLEWNENNFDINCCSYVKEAYEERKWAFITDYVRLWVMFNYGGIYMDTDVEVIGTLDSFLKHRAFSGFESNTMVPTGIMASEKGMPIIGDLLKYYEGRHFLLESGVPDLTTNVITITKYFQKKGLQSNNTLQEIEGFVFYPNDYFCPKDYLTGKIVISENTRTIHHFMGTWCSEEQKRIAQMLRGLENRNVVIQILGKFCVILYGAISKIRTYGIKKTFRYYRDKYL